MRRGDLLRVTGLAPGLDGDRRVWWATTEGHLRLEALQRATSEYAQAWELPWSDEAPGGWWGVIVSSANVRAAPTTEAPVVGQLQAGQRVKVLAIERGEPLNDTTAWYRIDGGRYAGGRVHSLLVRRIAQPQPTVVPPGRAPADGTWVVDRRRSTLTVVRDGRPIFATYVSLGKTGRDTPPGVYRPYGQFRFDDMTSLSVRDAERSDDLPNVPYTQYFKDCGFAVHGTYWHDNFGTGRARAASTRPSPTVPISFG